MFETSLSVSYMYPHENGCVDMNCQRIYHNCSDMKLKKSMHRFKFTSETNYNYRMNCFLIYINTFLKINHCAD